MVQTYYNDCRIACRIVELLPKLREFLKIELFLHEFSLSSQKICTLHLLCILNL